MDEFERMRAGLHPPDHRAQRAAAEAEEAKAGMRDALRAPSRLFTHGGIVTPLDPKSGRPAAPKPVTRRPEGAPVQRAAGSGAIGGEPIPFRKREPAKPVQQPTRPASPPPLRPAANAVRRVDRFVDDPAFHALARKHGVVGKVAVTFTPGLGDLLKAELEQRGDVLAKSSGPRDHYTLWRGAR